MKLVPVTLAVALLAGVPLVAAAAFHEGAPPPAQPGPEHAVLKHMVGTWDASVQMAGMPEADEGTHTTKLGMNGLWIVSDFEGAVMGGPFIGHDVIGYDTAKKKYVGCWVDSMTSAMTLSEGTWDAASKTLTMTTLAPDPMTGQPSVMKTKVTDADHHTWTMHAGSGDAPAAMTITYTRRK